MATTKGPLDLALEGSDKFLLALGRLVADSALVEARLDWLLWFLIGSHETAKIVAAELDFRRKIDLVLALAKEKLAEEDIWRDIRTILRGLHELYTERNKYLHGMWQPSTTNEQRGLVRVSAKGEYNVSVTDVDVPRIENLAGRFNEAAARLDAAIFRYMMS